MSVVSLEDFLNNSLARLSRTQERGVSPLEQKALDTLARTMDDVLSDVVSQLEAAARCQQPAEAEIVSAAQTAPSTASADMPSIQGLCAGLEQVATALVPHIFEEFDTACQRLGVQPRHVIWIAEARADAFAAYLVQLARVHGITGGAAPVSEAEKRALFSLEKSIKAMIHNTARFSDQA